MGIIKWMLCRWRASGRRIGTPPGNRQSPELCAGGRRGQNTVEYLLILAVIVGLVLLVGSAMKAKIPALFETISNLMSGAVTKLTGDQTGS